MYKYLILLIIGLLVSGCSQVSVNPTEQVIVDHNVEKGHDGELHVSYLEINSTGTNYIKLNSSNKIHLIRTEMYAITTGSDLDYQVDIYEGGSDSSSSNLLNNFNFNRNFNDQQIINIYSSVSGVSLGTYLPFSHKEVSDKKVSSMFMDTQEFIMKSDTDYYYRIRNNNGGTLTLALRFIYYKEN